MKSEKLHTEIIFEACKRCFPVELWLQNNLGTVKYQGCLLPSEGHADRPEVRASVHRPAEDMAELDRGTDVRVFFLNAGGIYSFQTQVQSWTPYKGLEG